ncbi:MAG: hypothetical protein Q7S45_03750 [Candidatus Curtissbacteria bacterium]|nr:hypothetical protein [Candidatus Curtissbacteria bacterium]
MIAREMKAVLSITAWAVLKGVLAALFLLTLYFAVVSLVSGWDFAKDQFTKFWYFTITLALGFGIQIGLYSYLKSAIRQAVSAKVVAASGATSTVAMISCCAHYLATILPILGITGIITIISQYQVRLFWIGLAFNLAGISYMLSRLIKYTRPV